MRIVLLTSGSALGSSNIFILRAEGGMLIGDRLTGGSSGGVRRAVH